VPLGVDILRYIESFKENIVEDDLFFKYELFMARHIAKQLKYRSEIGLQATSFGAQVHTKVSRKITHLVVSANRTRTQKVRQATKYPHIKIVNQQWLLDSMSRWEKIDETPYLVCTGFSGSEITSPIQSPALSPPERKIVLRLNFKQIHVHRDDKSPQIESYSDAQSVEDSSGDDFTEDDENSAHGGGEDQDTDGDAPADLAEGQSPIDGLKEVDWSGVDAELEEFMASGSEDDGDSDNESVSSSKSTGSLYSAKHASNILQP
jgi:RNA polymerase II subunit A-like phosphatase